MEYYCLKVLLVAIASLILLLQLPNTQGWGDDGHAIVCQIAQSRLSDSAAEAVRKLLPDYAENDLASLCRWPDYVKRTDGYSWSYVLHYADTPDFVCNFQNERDCKDPRSGEKGRCVVAAIHNYTSQLLTYGTAQPAYNLTEALLFLSHFIGDIHQPLHCGFVSDSGGNKIPLKWYKKETNLHHVWDDHIIETTEERFYDSSRAEYVKAIQHNITTEWPNQVGVWEKCNPYEIPCPISYASESVEVACKWAYKDVSKNAVLEDDYFLSRLPIVTKRLAQGGVRLATTLNHIFEKQSAAVM